MGIANSIPSLSAGLHHIRSKAMYATHIPLTNITFKGHGHEEFQNRHNQFLSK